MLMIKLIGLRSVRNIKIKANMNILTDDLEIAENSEQLFDEEPSFFKDGNIL